MTSPAPLPRRPSKRALDVVVAGTLLALGAPLAIVVVGICAVASVVRPPDRGPLLYRERRISRGREFDLLKLRTLRVDVIDEVRRSGSHARVYEADPANLTWAGRRLLKPWYLDELPQLVNVLRGDMSLVGPRPWPPEMVAAQVARGVDYRLRVDAGWTGPAQVSKGSGQGFENLDEVYLRGLAGDGEATVLLRDLRLLLQTVRTMARGEGLSY